jgi:hypothetical protein
MTATSEPIWLFTDARDDVTVGGSAQALKQLGAVLAAHAEGQHQEVEVSGHVPRGQVLRGVRITRDMDRPDLTLALDGDVLAITGPAGGLRWLAEVVDDFAGGQIQGDARHLHVEAYPGHPYLAAESLPAVLVLAE